MTQIVWDATGDHIFEAGVDRGVFCPIGGVGIPWNGLISVNEAPSGSDYEDAYIDGQRYRSGKSSGSFSATVSAFTYPDYLDDYPNQPFNFAYRTKIGNDILGLDFGYKIHLVYNAVLDPTIKDYRSLGKEVNLVHFSWDLSTTPFAIQDGKATAHLVVDSTKIYPETLILFEDMLYGTDFTNPIFPSIQEVLDIFESTAILKITDHGDGSFTAEGPDDVVYLTDATSFEISWPSAVFIDTESYRVRSL